jgi:glutamate synthase (NADPH) large chain
MLFMPKDDELRERCRAAFEGCLEASGMKLLCWRKVPTCNDEIGHTAKMAEVCMQAYCTSARQGAQRSVLCS